MLLLIIAKEALTRALLGAELQEEGYDVIGAGSIQEALQLMSKPDILFIDLLGQDMRAIELLNAVYGSIPLVLCSGPFDPPFQYEWKGEKYQLTKPITIGQIAEKIKEVKPR